MPLIILCLSACVPTEWENNMGEEREIERTNNGWNKKVGVHMLWEITMDYVCTACVFWKEK